eukprot:g16268.t1
MAIVIGICEELDALSAVDWVARDPLGLLARSKAQVQVCAVLLLPKRLLLQRTEMVERLQENLRLDRLPHSCALEIKALPVLGYRRQPVMRTLAKYCQGNA